MSKLDAELDAMVETGQWCVGKKLVSAVRHDDGIKYTFDDGSTQWWALVLPESVHKVALLVLSEEYHKLRTNPKLCTEQFNTRNDDGFSMSATDWVMRAATKLKSSDEWRIKAPINYPAWLEEYKG